MRELIINKNGIEKEVSKTTILSGEVFQLDPTKQFKGHVYNKENEVGIRMVLTFPPYRKVKGLHEYIACFSELKVNHPTGFVTETHKLRASIDILNGEIIVDDGQYPIRTTYISVPMHEVDTQDTSVTLKFDDCHGINAYADTDSKRLYIHINNEQYKNKYYYVNLDFDDTDDNNGIVNNGK